MDRVTITEADRVRNNRLVYTICSHRKECMVYFDFKCAGKYLVEYNKRKLETPCEVYKRFKHENLSDEHSKIPKG